MIKITHPNVYNMENAFRGLRNPMNSWPLSDSQFIDKLDEDGIGWAKDIIGLQWATHYDISSESEAEEIEKFIASNGTDERLDKYAFLGPIDLTLGARMVAAGSDEGKFARQIFVSIDIDAPLYWWKEMDQYKVGTTTNSTSTMHKLTSQPFTQEMFSFDNLDILHNGYNHTFKNSIEEIIGICEELRQLYILSKDKKYWRALVQILPSSFNQKRTWTANYQVLRTIYFQRRHHKLSEWKEFCNFIETLPYSEDLITIEK